MTADYYITINYAPTIGIAFLFLVLLTNADMEREIKRIFYALLLLETIEMIAYSVELETASWAYPSKWRILLSAIGYTIRPVLVYLHLKLTRRQKLGRRGQALLVTPLIYNTLVAFSAFFTPIAYTYTQQNEFVRGPLGYTTQVVTSLYLLILLLHTASCAKVRSWMETAIVAASVTLCAAAMIVEAAFLVRSIGRTSIVMATIFYYMFFQSQTYKATLEAEKDHYQHLKEQARHDRLTGLLDKTAFSEEASDILAEREKENVALIFFDLDRFKQVNDSLGHIAGDVLLRQVAEKLKTLFRSSDLIGRFGGDEFYILMCDATYEIVYAKVKALLAALEMSFVYEGEAADISASIGVAYLEREIPAGFTELVALADAAVYEAKGAGRNRYVLKRYMPPETGVL